ncbi:MAG TPA: DUF6600 domain-containing protein [Burkholderiales bacterium]|nr:DUF6600 domain-containing protein [Burkholderiales bacterium]
MDMPTLHRRLLTLAAFLTLTFSGWAEAEPPSRAARLSYISGTVSFSPAGQPDWVRAVVNRPLTTGDRLWADDNSRAELQVGGAAIRLGAFTSVTLLNLDDRIAQVQLSQGTLKVRVRRMGQNQLFEVNTPNLAFTLRRAGEYRIDVDPNGDATAVMVQSGRAEVYGDGASYVVNPQQGYRFYGTGLSDYERLAARRDDDDLDRWARERDRRGDSSLSARYVSPELVGYEDLDANGNWRVDPNYGNVWTPTRVAAGWTPYRDGHWAWIDPWGWSWVDDAPWGYAVSHYGRWANIRGIWTWVPGPPREQAVYAPALVAFVGGNNFQATLSIGSTIAAAVGWFPLAPREVYQPSYPVSRRYFDNINRSNAVIAPTTITNVYNTTNVTNNTTIVNKTINVTKVVYVNQQVTGAVVAVPAQAFVQSQPVAKAMVRVSREAAVSAPVVHVAAVAPVQQSVNGNAPNAGTKPPAREHAVVARTAPPPPPVAFIAQQQQLAAKPGAPIDEVQRKQLKPAVPAVSAPKVSVVTTAQAPPTASPPATPPAGKSRDARKADTANTDAGKAKVGKTDDAKSDAAEAVKAEAAKADATRIDATKAEAMKADAAKGATVRAEAAKADAANAESAKAATAKGRVAKDDAAKAEAVRAEAVRVGMVKADAAKGTAAKAEAANAEATKVEAAKATAAKAEAVKADAARGAAAKADAAKVETAKGEAMKADAARDAAARAEAAKADAARVEAAKADAAKGAAAKTDAAKADAARAETARVGAAKAEAMKADAARAATARAEAAKPVGAAPPSTARPRASKPDPDATAEEDKEKGKGKKRSE